MIVQKRIKVWLIQIGVRSLHINYLCSEMKKMYAFNTI